MRSKVKKKKKYLNDYSGYSDEVLYRMCKEKPLHNDIDIIQSKLLIIGRTYSAAIERKAGPDFRMENAAEILRDSDIDKHIGLLRKIKRVKKCNLGTLLCAHKYLTDVMHEATGLNKRSLASKYLHFHAPKAVFIFDTIAKRNIRGLIPPRTRFTYNGTYDDEYEKFALRCLFFRDNVLERQLGGKASPRRIDMQLLGHAGAIQESD